MFESQLASFLLPACIFAILCLFAYDDGSDFRFFITAMSGIVLSVGSCSMSDSYRLERQEKMSAEAARDERDRTPHVIREADGCKVYAFKSQDRWHYFTRCPDSKVSTDTTHVERSGKTTRQVTTTIETQK